ncbi:MAG TPA: CBS domain-containing protein [Mesorhizobium sp.]|nr:CBS domain-containing protein [Mesorhizobium sp.]
MRKLGHVTLEHCPITLNQAATVAEACDRMRDGQAGSVLVTDNSGTLVGIFTGRDAVCRVLAQRRDAATTPLAEVMTANPTTMLPDQTTVDALRLMRDGGFRHLPLVKNQRIVGLVSRSEVLGVRQRDNEEERDLWEHLR